MPNISSATTIKSVQLTEQTTAPDQPSTGYFRIYASSGSVLRAIDDSGNDYPFSTGSSAPDLSTQTFIVVTTSSQLSNERYLAGTANRVTVADGGAGNAVTLSAPQDLHTGASVQFASVTASTGSFSTVVATSASASSAAAIGTGSLDSSASLHVVGQYYSRMVDDGTISGTTCSFNWSSGNEHKAVLSSNTTVSFANGVTGGRYVLLLKQDGTGSRTVTWPVSVLWPSASAPTLSTTASKTDLFTFFFDGTNYYGNSSLTH